MSDLRRLYVELATNVRPLVAGMAQGSVAVKKLGKDVGGLGVDMDRLSAKAVESARRVVESQKRVEAAQARLNTVRASGRASVQQQASAEAQLMAAERNLARAHTQAADASKAAQGGLVALEQSGARTRNILSSVALVAGAGLAAGLFASARAAMELEKSLYNVASISPQVAADTGKYRDVLVKMSTELPQSANELAAGLYQIVSSGFQADDALTILDASARAASAGLSTTGVAATAISATLKAYGLTAASASDVSDVLFETVNKGVITFEELAQGIGDYIGTGAAAKVSVGELGAAVAAMTLSGVTAAESGTSLNRVLQSLIKPGDALKTTLHQLGYESGAQALAADGLHGVMEKLRATTGGNVEELLRLFPEIRAARGAFALMANEGQNYSQSFDDIATVNGRVGATMQALEQQQKTAAYQTTILKNQAVALGIQLGQDLLPAIKFIVGGLHDFLGLLQWLPGPVTAVAAVLMALSGAALLGVGAFIRYRAPIAAFRASLAAMRAEGSALPGVLRGISIASAGVAAALLIGTLIYGQYAKAKAEARQATDDFVEALKREATGEKNAVLNSAIDKIVKDGSAGRLRKYGLDVQTYLRGILGSQQEYDAAQKAIHTRAFDKSLPSVGKDDYKLYQSLDKYRKSYGNARLEVELTGKAQAVTTKATEQALGPLADLDNAAKTAASGTVELTDAQKGLRDQLAGMVDASDAAKTALTALTDPSKVLSDVQQQLTADTKAANTASKSEVQAQNERELRAAQDRVRNARNGSKAEKQAAQDNLTTVKRANKDRLAALTSGAADQQVTLGQWTAGLRTAARDQATWEADLTTVARRAGVGVADALRAMGKDAVPIVHQLATGTQAEVDQVKSALASLEPSARQSLTAFVQELAKQVAEQASYVGNLISLGARGHVAIVQQLETMPVEQAAPLAAQAAKSSDKALAPWEAALKRRAAIAGDGTTEALAAAVESGMQVVTLAASNGAQAAVDALVQRFGGIDQAVLYLDNLRTAITDVTGRHQIDVILNLLATQGTTRVGPLPQPGRQGHSRDPDFLPSGGGTAAPKAGTVSSPATRDARFADGGLRDAQIQPGRGRGMFQWAEASTGGEAFIPLGPAKRQRSARILHDVAHRFGMAVVPAGGVQSFADGGVRRTSPMPFESRQMSMHRVSAEVDVERLARVVMRAASAMRPVTKHYQVDIHDAGDWRKIKEQIDRDRAFRNLAGY
jgi:TP901 family phage tail tape measure protein